MPAQFFHLQFAARRQHHARGCVRHVRQQVDGAALRYRGGRHGHAGLGDAVADHGDVAGSRLQDSSVEDCAAAIGHGISVLCAAADLPKVEGTLRVMHDKYRYNDESAKEAIAFVYKVVQENTKTK